MPAIAVAAHHLCCLTNRHRWQASSYRDLRCDANSLWELACQRLGRHGPQPKTSPLANEGERQSYCAAFAFSAIFASTAARI